MVHGRETECGHGGIVGDDMGDDMGVHRGRWGGSVAMGRQRGAAVMAWEGGSVAVGAERGARSYRYFRDGRVVMLLCGGGGLRNVNKM